MSTHKNVLFAIGFTAIGAVLGTAGLAIAGGGPGGHGGPGGRGGFGAHLYHLYAELDLTEAQQTQLDAVRDFVRDEAEQDRDDRMADAEKVSRLLSQANPDRNTIHKLIDERAAQKVDLAHDTVDKILDLHATLTDAQRAELVSDIEEMRARHEEREEQGPPEEGRRGR